MVDAPPRRLFEGWGPLASLPQDLQEQLHPQLRSISLQPGEMLYDFEHLPPGVLYLQQGQLRLLGLDQRKEPFTLERYNSGQLAGAELLLRGIPGQAMAASTALQASLLPAELFLDDAHLTSEGNRLVAEDFVEALGPWIRGAGEGEEDGPD